VYDNNLRIEVIIKIFRYLIRDVKIIGL